MEPVKLSIEVAPIPEWPDERLQAAYGFFARRLDRLMGAPGDASAEVESLRPHCEAVGMELVARGLL